MHRPGKVMFCTLLCLLSLGALTDTSRRAQASGESSSSAPASAQPAARTQHRVHPDAPPDGVSAQDWAGIRQAYEENRHRAFRVAAGYQARNPGQQWQTHFDGRGFVVQPDAGAWRWGLALRSYGFSGHARPLAEPACVTAQGRRVAYAWDETLEEWFVNESRGLEHGFTIKARPAGGAATDARLELRLAVRGGLRPQVQAEGGDVSFVDEQGQAAVNYTGLMVYDANGRRLPAQFAAAGAELRLTVDERGARYPLTIDPWAQQVYLKASNTGAGDEFGLSVAISGDTIVVGAYLEDSNATGVNGNQSNNSASAAGAVYVFVRSGVSWSQQAYLKASNTEAIDLFGLSVAISGDTIVVGAREEDSNATGVNGNQGDNSAANSGAAYVFVRSGTNWSQQAYLKASNTEAGDRFGHAVAISGDTIVVGALAEDSSATGVNGNQSNNSALDAGAAYIFARSGTSWSQQAYLKASNTEAFDLFGDVVAISGDTIVVGAREEDSNATGVNGNQSDNSASGAGAAYVFVRSGTSWSQQAYLKASNTGAGDQFGGVVAISGDTIVVGAWGEASNATGVNGNQSNNSALLAGAAYVFVRSGTTWSQQAYLKASNTEALDFFGREVAIFGDTIVVGAPGEASNATGVNGNQSNNSAPSSGAAYVFVRNGTSWSQQAYLKASNTGVLDQFGSAVAISGETIVVGAPREASNAIGINGNQSDNSAPEAGAAYVFVRLIAPTISKAFNPTSIQTGGSSTVTLTLTNTNGSALTNGSFTDLLLGGLSATGGAVSGTCTGTTPALLTQGQTALSFSGITIPALGSCTVTFAVTSTTPGTPTNQTSGVTSDQNTTPGNPSNVAQLTVSAPPGPPLGPGLPFPATTEVSGQNAGSVLVYNFYSSSASALNSQNTRLSITNVNPASDIAVHLFFVDGQTCSIADALICLTKNQTASFLASDLDPGTTGYIVAVASDPTTGCPVNFNFLIGDAYVKLSSGHAANLGAEAFSALAGGPVACDGNSVTATLNFDGVSYNRVPRTLAASSIPAREDGNDTLLIVNRLGGNLAIGAATLSNLFGIFYDDAENAVSFTFSPGTCQFRSSLSNNFPRTTPRLETFIPAGRSGWLRLYSTSDIGLLGAVLNFNATTTTNAGAFNQGRNLHKLTLSSAQTLVIPIFPPNCLD